jgi:hypothetical protein
VDEQEEFEFRLRLEKERVAKAPRNLKASNPAEYDTASPEFQERYGAEQPGIVAQVAGRALRMGGQAVAALPLAAMDAGVAVRNMLEPKPQQNLSGLITGQQPKQDQYQLPSEMWNENLNKIIPAPQDLAGKVSEIVGSAVLSSRIPVPSAAQQAPAAFQRPVSQAITTLKEAQKLGLVVPPATSNPNAVNRVLEGAAGKLTTAQAAAAKNRAALTNVAKRHIGLPEDAPLTMESIKAVRAEAGKAYEVVRQAGRINSDTEYRAALINLFSKHEGAAKDFGKLAKNQDVDDIFTSLNQKSFDADSAVDMISILRDKADDAFRAGSSQTGKAYREASKILEGAIERHLKNGGKQSAEMLKSFRDARTLIAKTYSVEKAFNQSTGYVSGTKLAQQLAKGKPLSGELRTAAKFAQAFPKAARDLNESLPGISPLDFYGAGGVAAVSGKPWYLLYPFLRQGTRSTVLSKFGQRAAIPRGIGMPSEPLAAGTANALALLGQE